MVYRASAVVIPPIFTCPTVTVAPPYVIAFTLSRTSTPIQSVMTLTAPINSDDFYIFKVKTTQIGRYFVKPNMGIMKPGDTTIVTITLADKDKQLLTTEFEQGKVLGVDKFIVQTASIGVDFYNEKKGESVKEIWNKVAKDQVTVNKLTVEHTFDEAQQRRVTPATHAHIHSLTSLLFQTLASVFWLLCIFTGPSSFSLSDYLELGAAASWLTANAVQARGMIVASRADRSVQEPTYDSLSTSQV